MIIDTATNQQIGEVEVGERPWGIAVSFGWQHCLHGEWAVERRLNRGRRQQDGQGEGEGRLPPLGHSFCTRDECSMPNAQCPGGRQPFVNRAFCELGLSIEH